MMQSAAFLQKYVDMKILSDNPFQVLDRKGVGQLMDMAVKAGRATRKILRSGSAVNMAETRVPIEFRNMIGLNYVSCSPFRVLLQDWQADEAALGQLTKDK